MLRHQVASRLGSVETRLPSANFNKGVGGHTGSIHRMSGAAVVVHFSVPTTLDLHGQKLVSLF